MHLMRVTVLLDDPGSGRSVTYAVVASSAYEAAELISKHLKLRQPSGRIDVDVLADRGVEGPPRVLGPVKGGEKAL